MSAPFTSPELVELAFYRAFETRDAQAMEHIWAKEEDIICVHPMAAALSGRQEILRSWQEIFSAGATMRVSLEMVQIYSVQNLAVHVVVEHIEVSNGKRVAPILATNLYRHSDQGWHMLAHHASPMPSPTHGQTHPHFH